MTVYRATLAEIPREELSRTWAMTQNNLATKIGLLQAQRGVTF